MAYSIAKVLMNRKQVDTVGLMLTTNGEVSYIINGVQPMFYDKLNARE